MTRPVGRLLQTWGVGRLLQTWWLEFPSNRVWLVLANGGDGSGLHLRLVETRCIAVWGRCCRGCAALSCLPVGAPPPTTGPPCPVGPHVLYNCPSGPSLRCAALKCGAYADPSNCQLTVCSCRPPRVLQLPQRQLLRLQGLCHGRALPGKGLGGCWAGLGWEHPGCNCLRWC